MCSCPRCKKENVKLLNVYNPFEALEKLENEDYKTFAEKQELLYVAANEDEYAMMRLEEDEQYGPSYICDYCGHRFRKGISKYDGKGFTEITEEEYDKELDDMFLRIFKDEKKKNLFKANFLMFNSLDKKDKYCKEDIEILEEKFKNNMSRL